jgi:hypothetical protein
VFFDPKSCNHPLGFSFQKSILPCHKSVSIASQSHSFPPLLSVLHCTVLYNSLLASAIPKDAISSRRSSLTDAGGKPLGARGRASPSIHSSGHHQAVTPYSGQGANSSLLSSDGLFFPLMSKYATLARFECGIFLFSAFV